MIMYLWLTFSPNQNIKYIFKLKNFQLIKDMRKVNFFYEVKLEKSYDDLVQYIYEVSSFPNVKSFNINDEGQKVILPFPEMIFNIIGMLLNYGFLRH